MKTTLAVLDAICSYALHVKSLILRSQGSVPLDFKNQPIFRFFMFAFRKDQRCAGPFAAGPVPDSPRCSKHKGSWQGSNVSFACPHILIFLSQCYYLLGKHRLAIDVYNQAQKMGFDDWELCHSKGLCHFQLGDMTEALKSFKRANILQVRCV